MPAVPAAPVTTILVPGDPGWDDARRAWNLAVDQHPAAVALPASAHEVAEAVRFAREHGLRIAAQGTGHNAAPLGPLAGTVLVKTERMRQVTIDPAARIARAEAGAVWRDVVEAAAEHDLAALAGVLQAWRELTHGALPEEFASSARLVNFPPIPDLPAHLRGRSFVIVTVVHLGAPDEADAMLAPLRALSPVTDTIQTIPAKALSRLHLDPGRPTPGVGDGLMLASLPPAAIETLIRIAGPESGGPPLTTELIHIGGEMKRVRPANGALASIDAEYALFAGGLAPFPQAASAVARGVAAVQAAMSRWAAPQMYLNLAETRRDPAAFWTPQAYDRLRRIKTRIDPDDLIHANHPIAPLTSCAPARPARPFPAPDRVPPLLRDPTRALADR